ncbi:dolichyl-diphosphooligosaccharide-protein glycotransferase KNAG_0L00720 [Huiozyma naganishii CBS 8797]|uniref:Dolichyl-diphosphooligosaccharide--protein glycosyltransferase subunit WBP1 n=1 Tax=Huiozyma naganishii (strain ATCC MYA-139 / BCRC 22969 / CBS 8797 / KCTC 17520 / NBRC 10181 / NCYC 3082 / Yp74L-3) TaxID=1071383 RepID=J7RS25_HUIN7|nr:hypothetical protein KNAG_0L00720 [Kazachstania naganishii CBS 8797]CCK72693.1 hypothetical protein KNAG_0L00720 [Kazachstania naganishii CBS 8797]
MLFQVFALLASCLLAVQGLSLTGSRTLVVHDDKNVPSADYSKFVTLLKGHSLELSFVDVSEEDVDTIELFQMEDRKYDNLIVFPIKGKLLNKKVSSKALLQFFDKGGNIFTMTSPNAVAEPLRNYLNQLGIYPSPKGQQLVDYFQSDSAEEVLKVSSNLLQNRFVFESPDGKTSFSFGKSSVALLDNREQIVPILRASQTATINGKGDEEPWIEAGSQGYVVTGFQGLNNARTSWVGSVDFLKDESFNTNDQFISELIKWTFQEKSVIKSTGALHTHADGTPYDTLKYKVNDEVNYKVGLSEWVDDKWVPFVADDVQFELRQVDPYYRLTMVGAETDGEVQYYTTGDFKLPNRHGMFTFLTDYRREGLTFIREADVRAIRHLANDEYLRSWAITNAWVYMATIYVVIVSFVAFLIIFLTTSSKDKKATVTKKTN